MGRRECAQGTVGETLDSVVGGKEEWSGYVEEKGVFQIGFERAEGRFLVCCGRGEMGDSTGR